jgi:hypothetical protein
MTRGKKPPDGQPKKVKIFPLFATVKQDIFSLKFVCRELYDQLLVHLLKVGSRDWLIEVKQQPMSIRFSGAVQAGKNKQI